MFMCVCLCVCVYVCGVNGGLQQMVSTNINALQLEVLSALDRAIVEESMKREAAEKKRVRAEAAQAAVSDARAKLQAVAAVAEADVAAAKAARSWAAEEFSQVRGW